MLPPPSGYTVSMPSTEEDSDSGQSGEALVRSPSSAARDSLKRRPAFILSLEPSDLDERWALLKSERSGRDASQNSMGMDSTQPESSEVRIGRQKYQEGIKKACEEKLDTLNATEKSVPDMQEEVSQDTTSSTLTLLQRQSISVEDQELTILTGAVRMSIAPPLPPRHQS